MDTPALKQLMQGYFHQDWDIDGSPEEVVDVFLEGETTLAPLLPGEIRTVLETHRDEDSTAGYVQSLNNEFDPVPDYGGYRSWLEAIAARAELSREAD